MYTFFTERIWDEMVNKSVPFTFPFFSPFIIGSCATAPQLPGLVSEHDGDKKRRMENEMDCYKIWSLHMLRYTWKGFFHSVTPVHTAEF